MGFQLIALFVDDHMATGIFNLCTYAITGRPPSSSFASLALPVWRGMHDTTSVRACWLSPFPLTVKLIAD